MVAICWAAGATAAASRRMAWGVSIMLPLQSCVACRCCCRYVILLYRALCQHQRLQQQTLKSCLQCIAARTRPLHVYRDLLAGRVPKLHSCRACTAYHFAKLLSTFAPRSQKPLSALYATSKDALRSLSPTGRCMLWITIVGQALHCGVAP